MAKLSQEQKNVVVDAAKNAEALSWTKLNAVEANIYSYAKSGGMSIKRPSADDLIAWRICSSSILESFMSRAGRPGNRLLGAYGKLRADPCCSVDTSVASAR
jgi:TRAP-type C4-dicarboxylate transport system substrate-binding protein